MRDYGIEAQAAAEAHLGLCEEALWEEQEGHTNVKWPDTAGPYDGCETCQIREILFAAWPLVREAVLHETPTKEEEPHAQGN